MSNEKRPGARDISDLKARLGIKKGGTVPPPMGAPAGVPRPNRPSGTGITAPPGAALDLGASSTSMQAVPSAPPVVHDDPLRAMNAIAQQASQAPARAAEYIVINDGKPVEDVGHDNKAAKYGKIAAMIAVPLFLGVGVGRAARGASEHNTGIDNGKVILKEVKDVKKTLADVRNEMEAAQKEGFRPNPTLTTSLETLGQKLEVKAEQVYRSKQGSLGPDVSGGVMNFYAGVTELRSMTIDHVKMAQEDDKAQYYQAAKDAASKAASPIFRGGYKYAVVVSSPDGGPTGARLVEVGGLYCGDSLSRDGNCAGGSPSGIAFRDRQGDGNFFEKASLPKADGGQRFGNGELIPFLSSEVLDAVVKKGEPTAAEILYRKRLDQLYRRVDELIDQANNLEKKLSSKVAEGKRFSFFM